MGLPRILSLGGLLAWGALALLLLLALFRRSLFPRLRSWLLVLLLAAVALTLVGHSLVVVPLGSRGVVFSIEDYQPLNRPPLESGTNFIIPFSQVVAFYPLTEPRAPTIARVVPTASPTLEPTFTAEPSPTAEPSATLPPTPTPAGGGYGQIAFASDRSGSFQIWLVNQDGGDLVQLTELPGGACQPAWSPDGARLALISPCTGNQDDYPGSAIWLVDADGVNLEPLAGSQAGDFNPQWSSDGQSILFTTNREGPLQIYQVYLEGGLLVNLSQNNVQNLMPALSPGGGQLAYVSNSSGQYLVYVLDLTTRQIVQFSRSADRSNKNPVWSPDGTRLFFTQSRSGGLPGIVSATLAQQGFDERFLLGASAPSNREAALSPDGFWVAYEGWPDGINHDIYIISAGGSGEPFRLTDEPSFDFDPAWRPAH